MALGPHPASRSELADVATVSGRPHFLQAVIGQSGENLKLWTLGDGRLVARRLETAFDSASRNRGLLGRNGLDDGVALVLAPCSAIHTFRMKFSIDVIFAARDGRVVKLRRNMPPSRMSAAIGAFAVIEMAAGAIDCAGLEVGARLEVRAERTVD